MNKLFVFCFACICFSIAAFSQTYIIGTFNVRYDTPRDSANSWTNRAPICASLIRFHQFDIVGTQEGLTHQLEDLKKSLPEYAYYGLGRDDGQLKGEHSAIFYKKAKYSVLDSGDFWLSETPQKPGYGWDARINRICSWLKLRDKASKNSFYVFNVHYDHQGIEARKESSKLILKKIKEIARTEPVILTGDFNGNHKSQWYVTINTSSLLTDALLQVKDPYISNGSYNNFQSGNLSKEIIDHIFISRQFSARRYGILTDTYHGKFPSDHYPVLVELVLKK